MHRGVKFEFKARIFALTELILPSEDNHLNKKNIYNVF